MIALVKKMSNYSCFTEGGSQVLWNVVGGAITAALAGAYTLGRRTLFRRSFRKIFGADVGTQDFHLAYALLSLKDLTPPDPMPYRKPGSPDVHISISYPVSFPEVRSAKYLSEGIASNRFSPPHLTSDIDLNSRLDISFIAFGGPLSNSKSKDAIECQNALLRFDNQEFRSPKSNKIVVKRENGFDYGLILKVHPNQFPKRTWITCAGVGEWGSSGAAWYLAKKWSKILAFAGSKEFAVVVKVRGGQDESAEPVLEVTSLAEAENSGIG